MKMKIVVDTISYLFILLFVYAGFSKLFDYEQFVLQIEQSPILHMIGGFRYFVAALIPLVEIVIAVLFLVSLFRKIAFRAALVLMTLFTGYIISILYIAPYVPCSCGGVLEGLGWEEHLIFNIVFMLLGVLAVVIDRKKEANVRNEFSSQ